jgi:hypothetical protein
MKKILQIIATGGLVLLLSACGCQKKTAQETGGPQTAAPSEAPASQPESGIISSIKDAMGLGKKMECTYKIKMGDGTLESKTYVEGKKYKGTTVIEGKTQNSVFDGKVMYIWAEGEKTGMKFDVECMEGLQTETPPSDEAPTPPQYSKEPEDFEDAMDVY